MNVTDNLIAGETVVFESKKHWIAPLRDSLIPIGLLVLFFVVGAIRPDATTGFMGLVAGLMGTLQWILVIVAAGWIVYNVAVWWTAHFAVTNLRVLRSEGIIQRRTSETMLAKVTDVRLNVGVVGRQLGYGDVRILTGAGEAAADLFRTITDAAEFRNAMMTQQMGDQLVTRAAMTAAASRATAAPSAAPPAPAPKPAAPAPSPASAPTTSAAASADAIKQLGELRDQGLLTPEEFEAKKAEILARI